MKRLDWLHYMMKTPISKESKIEMFLPFRKFGLESEISTIIRKFLGPDSYILFT